jgi:hypothetical protein
MPVMIRKSTANMTTAPLLGAIAAASFVLFAAMCGAVAGERSGAAVMAQQSRVPPSPSRAPAAPSGPLPGQTPIGNVPAAPSAPIVTPLLKFVGAGPLAAKGTATTMDAGGMALTATPSGASQPIATEQLRFIGLGQ